MLLPKMSREFKESRMSTPSIDTSRSSTDPYLSFKYQHQCQNPCSGLLCCHRLVYAYFELDIEQNEIHKALQIKQETEWLLMTLLVFANP